MTHSIQKWSDDADAKLHDCFASTDWNIFWDSSDGIEEYTTSVTGFINKCRSELKGRAAAFKESWPTCLTDEFRL